jgi:ABC-type amino acid transport substrate-binding protein
MRTLLAVLFCCLAALPCRADDTLDEIKSRQMLRCGVSTDYPGLAFQDDQGRWSGIEIDFCRAMAAALFADTAKVGFQPLPIQARFYRCLARRSTCSPATRPRPSGARRNSACSSPGHCSSPVNPFWCEPN